MDLLAKVTTTIEKYDLLQRGETALVALSGGPDSVALLHLLSRLRKTYELALHAVYVNHGIRPRAAKREERFCAELCDRLKVTLCIVRENIPALAEQEHRGLEETAREVRYRVLNRLADELHCDKIALGHHRDDQVETILFRLLRGTGRTGLIGMPPRRDRLIRPLFEVTRAEIEAYLKRRRLDSCVDASNRDLHYRRNFIRHKLLPLIRDNINPQVDTALLGLSELLTAEEEFLNVHTRKAVGKLLTVTPGGKLVLASRAYPRLDLWLRRRVLREIMMRLSPSGQFPDRETVERLDRFCLGGARALALPGQIRVERGGEEIVFRCGSKLHYELPLGIGKRNRLTMPRYDFYLREMAASPDTISHRRRAQKITIDRNKLAFPLVVRNIRSGDRFHPLGAGGSKKVGDYLTDRKLPVIYRDEVPVVCDRQGIVWLVGFEIDERVKVETKTERALTIERRIRKTGKTTSV